MKNEGVLFTQGRFKSLRLPNATAMLSLIGLSIGCTDPGIDLEFEIPEVYRDQVAVVSIQVFVPSATEGFGCDDIAFRAVSEEATQSSLVQELVLRDGHTGSLSGMPRLGNKVFYARGIDSQDLAVVEACAELGDVTSKEHLVLAGAPTIAVAVGGFDPGAPLPESVRLIVSDSATTPMSDIDVRWTMTGPGGETFSGETRSTENGEVVVEPTMPAAVGPSMLDIHARWERLSTPTILGFREPPVMFEGTLPGAIADETPRTESRLVVGRIGPDGEKGFAALGPLSETDSGRAVVVAYYDESQTPYPFRVAASEPLNIATIGIMRDEQRDRVVALSAIRWTEISPDGSVSGRVSPVVGRSARRMMSVGPCLQSAGPDVLLVTLHDESLEAFDVDGNLVASPFLNETTSSRGLSSGCVASITGDLHRVVVYSLSGFEQEVVAEMDTMRSGRWATFGSGIGFTSSIDTQGPRLLGTDFTIEGTAIGRYRLNPVGTSSLDLELVTKDDAPTFVMSAEGGDVDADGIVDVVAILDFGRANERTQYRVFMALGTKHQGERIVGLSPAIEGHDPRVLVADFDEDGTDDVLVGDSSSVRVLRMGVP